MRAKSIKNKARVNAELSPAELKALLKKAQRDYSNAGAYIGLLEREVDIWRSGGKVDKEQWATMEKALGLAPGELEKLVGPPGRRELGAPASGTSSRSFTPVNPALERVGEGEISRPLTPGVGLDKDEREEFLRRENELGDQLAKTVRSSLCPCDMVELMRRVGRNPKWRRRRRSFENCETSSARSRRSRNRRRRRTRR